MSNQGDLAQNQIIDFTFTTRNTSSVPTTLTGSPVISVYKANGTTQSIAGVTLIVDFDAVTGLNHVRVDTSADAFYVVGNDYSVVITTGTVGGGSVVGETVAAFSIENRASPWDDARSAHDVPGSMGENANQIRAAIVPKKIIHDPATGVTTYRNEADDGDSHKTKAQENGTTIELVDV